MKTVFYGELEINGYTYRTVGDTHAETAKTLKEFWLTQKEAWGIRRTWQETLEGGWVQIHELKQNQIWKP
jgi:hypothetical protein